MNKQDKNTQMKLTWSKVLLYAGGAIALAGAAQAQTLTDSTVTDAPLVTYGATPGVNTQNALSDPYSVDDDLLAGFHAGLGVSYAHHSDIFRNGSDVDDSIILISPSLAYKTYIGRHSAQIEYGALISRHDEFTSDDFEDHKIALDLDLDLGPKLVGDLYGAYTSAHESRGASSTRVIQSVTPDEVDIFDYGASLSYGPRTSKSLLLTAGVDMSEWEYQNNAQEFRNRDIFGVHGRLDYFLSAKTTAFARATHRDFDYVENPRNLDSTELTAEVGVSWQATEKTRGEVSAGHLEKNFDDPATDDDYSGATYRGNIRWMPKLVTGVNLYGSRRTEETTTLEDGFFLSNLVGVSIDHSFTEHWFGSVYFNYTEDEYDSGRNDEIDDFAVQLNYAFRRWLSVGAKYGHTERSSNFAPANYEDNYFILTVTGRASYLTGGDRGDFGRAQ